MLQSWAKQETKVVQKQFEAYKKSSEQSLTSFKEKLANMQEAQFELKAKTKVDLERMGQLQQEKRQLQSENRRLQSIAINMKKPLQSNKKKATRQKKSEINATQDII